MGKDMLCLAGPVCGVAPSRRKLMEPKKKETERKVRPEFRGDLCEATDDIQTESNHSFRQPYAPPLFDTYRTRVCFFLRSYHLSFACSCTI